MNRRATTWRLGDEVRDTLGKARESPDQHRFGGRGPADRAMENLTHYPLLVFAAAVVTLWLASLTGSWLRRRNPGASDEQNEDLGVILAATLTLLALIIGFSFSMATNRYEQRKNFEEGEANAISSARRSSAAV